VRIGLVLPMFSGDVEKVMAFARRAEELGYRGVFAFDHFFPPGAPPDRPSLEPFTVLSAVGAATERILVGTLVARASLRPAGLLAKMAASIDGITGGRMLLAIGSGDPIDHPEAEAYGFPMHGRMERRAHLEETVGAVKALFAGKTWPGGDHVPAMAGPLLPPPARDGPPVWVGGQSDELVRLAARAADGWNGWGLHLPEFARKADLLAEASAAAGRSCEPTWAGIVVVGRDDVEAGAMLEARSARRMLETNVWAGSIDAFVSFLIGLREAGASWTVLVPAGPPDRVEMIASVIPQVAGRV
jgi:alkanesulfonate monooxygenase SsuD/methylene tetrahydromethanopterin reductase-like flavin-dependent oxidoreductase (luciferase family)